MNRTVCLTHRVLPLPSYRLDLDGQITLAHTLPLPTSRCVASDQTGSLSLPLLSWSEDGCALAYAWRARGLTVWSVSGSLLFSTARDSEDMEESAFGGSWGVKALSWGPQGWVVCDGWQCVGARYSPCTSPDAFVSSRTGTVWPSFPSKRLWETLLHHSRRAAF